MAYYLSYIVLTEPGNRSGHASLAITEYSPGSNHPPIILTKIGLWGASQVLLEDDYSRQKPERHIFQKTWPISEVELQNFFTIVCEDRALYPPNRNISNKLHREKYTQPGGPTYTSIPGGTRYNLFTNNCKSYALSILQRLGINDPSIVNFGFQSPLLSGAMHPFTFRQEVNSNVMIWESPFIIENRTFNDSFTAAECDEINYTRTLDTDHYDINYQEINEEGEDSATATRLAAIDECAQYQFHLQRKIYQYAPSLHHTARGGFVDAESVRSAGEDILSNSTLPQNNPKLDILLKKHREIHELSNILYDNHMNTTEQLAKFQYRIMSEPTQNTLKSHRDSFGLKLLFVLCTGIIPGLLFLAAQSKFSSRNTFQFWKSTGEVTIDNLQERTAIHSSRKVKILR